MDGQGLPYGTLWHVWVRRHSSCLTAPARDIQQTKQPIHPCQREPQSIAVLHRINNRMNFVLYVSANVQRDSRVFTYNTAVRIKPEGSLFPILGIYGGL